MDYDIILNIMKITLTVGFSILGTYILTVIARYFFSELERSYVSKDNFVRYKIFKNLAVAGIYFFGALFSLSLIPMFKGLSVSLLASSGIVFTVVGLSAQAVLSNIISGFFLDFFQTIHIGEKISVSGISGVVEDITLRHTVLKTVDNKIILIPNSTINSAIIEKIN